MRMKASDPDPDPDLVFTLKILFLNFFFSQILSFLSHKQKKNLL